jgi:hypothetical protein
MSRTTVGLQEGPGDVSYRHAATADALKDNTTMR